MIASRKKIDEETEFKIVSNEEALSCEVIIPAIPSQFLEEYFSKNVALVNHQALIIDTRSYFSRESVSITGRIECIQFGIKVSDPG